MANTVQIMGLGGSVISVDTRKKELIGEFKNAGRERRLRASRWLSARMTSRDSVGKVVPYGVYDLTVMPAGCRWAPTMTRRPSPWSRSAAGGRRARQEFPQRPAQPLSSEERAGVLV
jgi:hypothetical protein